MTLFECNISAKGMPALPLKDLIASANDRLTPTERRIARLVLDDSTLLAFGTVSDLATLADTSRPSIVRFATKLGFEGYTDLQNWIRDGVAKQLSRPSQRIRHPQGSAATIKPAIEDAVRRTFEGIDSERLTRLALPIARSRNVWIVSGETSLAGAHVLSSGLSMIRPDVHMVEPHSAGRALTSATPEDTAIVFDFARYRKHSVNTAEAVKGLGVTIVAITDGPLSPLAAIADHWCELSIPAVGPFDSAVPAVTAAELLVAEVVALLGDAARERIDRLESLWQATGVFLDTNPR